MIGFIRTHPINLACAVTGAFVGSVATHIVHSVRRRRPRSLLLIDERLPNMRFDDGIAFLSARLWEIGRNIDAERFLVQAILQGRVRVWERRPRELVRRFSVARLTRSEFRRDLHAWRARASGLLLVRQDLEALVEAQTLVDGTLN